MPPLNQAPPAQAPSTRTMFGRPFISILPFSIASLPFAGRSNDLRQVWSFDPRCASHESVIRNAVAGPAWLRVHTRGRYARSAMSMVPGGELYGREAELALIQRELARVAQGTGGVILLQGGAGMGKSRLLAEVAGIARGLGFRVGTAAAEPSERVVELAGFLAALFEGTEPLLDRRELPDPRPQPEQRFWLLGDLQSLLERAALESPLLIGIDDAHWMDSGTAAALRTLPVRLAGLPIAWVITSRPLREAASPASGLNQLHRLGATEVVLGPLDHGAVARLAADLLGVDVGEEVLELLEQAGGSPYLLVEMLLGLRVEERIRIVDGRAELIDRRLPHRVREGLRERLGRLSEPTRTVASVAASLGRPFSVGDLARMLEGPPPPLVPP